MATSTARLNWRLWLQLRIVTLHASFTGPVAPKIFAMKNDDLMLRIGGFAPDVERTKGRPHKPPGAGRSKPKPRPEKDDTPCCAEFPDCSCAELLK